MGSSHLSGGSSLGGVQGFVFLGYHVMGGGEQLVGMLLSGFGGVSAESCTLC